MGIFNRNSKENIEKKEEKKKFKAKRKEAKSGDPSAQLYIGRCYLNGNGVKKNEKKGAMFLKSAADKALPEAMSAFADCLHYGIGVATDRYTAAKYCSDAADKGNADAQGRLGGYYLLGEGGMPKNASKAFQLIQQALAHGSVKGIYYFGYCLENAVMVAKDVERAAEHYKRAADRGEPDACNDIAKMYRNGTGVAQDLAQALYYYKKGAEGGCVNAQYGYARLLEDRCGAKKDYSEIAKWYKKAADRGHAEAMASLGSLYERDLAVAFDGVKTALALYEQSIKKGCARGYDYLGSYYERTLKVADRKNKAVQCYKTAAGKNYPDGMAHYGHCLRIGFGVAQDMALAKDYLQRAMKAGSAEAYCEWGLMLELSTYNQTTRIEAFSYYKKAADMGSARGQCELARCYYEGVGCSKDNAESARMGKLAAEQGHPGGLYWKDPKLNEKKAAQKGYPYAEWVYGRTLWDAAYEASNPETRAKLAEEAYDYIFSAAEHGDYGAMEWLVSDYGCGDDLSGIKRDPKKELEYAQKMVQYGSVRGYFMLGRYYDSEDWVHGEINDRKAFENYKIAADGTDFGPLQIGVMYLNGRGTEKNYAEALKYLRIAFDWYEKHSDWCTNPYNVAGYWLGVCYENGYGVQRDLAQAIKYYRSANNPASLDEVKELLLARKALKRLGY